MKKFLKRLFCRHEYEEEFAFMANGGLAKMYKLTCRKCGKTTYTTFTSLWGHHLIKKVVGKRKEEGEKKCLKKNY